MHFLKVRLKRSRVSTLRRGEVMRNERVLHCQSSHSDTLCSTSLRNHRSFSRTSRPVILTAGTVLRCNRAYTRRRHSHDQRTERREIHHSFLSYSNIKQADVRLTKHLPVLFHNPLNRFYISLFMSTDLIGAFCVTRKQKEYFP